MFRNTVINRWNGQIRCDHKNKVYDLKENMKGLRINKEFEVKFKRLINLDEGCNVFTKKNCDQNKDGWSNLLCF